MTLDELAAQLRDMPKGNYASVPYEMYEELFPPGEPDYNARGACRKFAKAHGCRIENQPQGREVWIVKDA